MTLTIRPESPADIPAIHELNRLAFGQDAEANLVDALRNGNYVRLSLVAETQDQIVGHILFTRLPIHTPHGIVEALSLAPIAVLPAFQRQGIGSRLIQDGLRLLREQGQRIVIVLGHTHYYPRFGFSPTLAQPITSPYSGSPAWMALELTPNALQNITGQAHYPSPFDDIS